MDNCVISKHNAGFFSCCSVKLYELVDFINTNKKLPDIVNSEKQFAWYKTDENINKDITYEYFDNYNDFSDNVIINYPINYHWWSSQFGNYLDLEYQNISFLVKKYFSPSKTIREIINNMENKYNLIYDNICVLFYRGNDKARETSLCSYDDYLNYANEIKNK